MGKSVGFGLDLREFFARGVRTRRTLEFAGIEALMFGVGKLSGGSLLLLLGAFGPLLAVLATALAIRVRHDKRLHPSAPSRLSHTELCRRLLMEATVPDGSLDLITTCTCGALVKQDQKERQKELGLPNWCVCHSGPEPDEFLPDCDVLLAVGSTDRSTERLYKCCISTADGEVIAERDETEQGSAIFDKRQRVESIQTVEEWKLMYPIDFTVKKKPKNGILFVDWYALATADRHVKRDLIELERGRLVR